jgi:transposase
MISPSLLPSLPGLNVEQIEVTTSLVTLWARTTTPTVACPLCHWLSSRVQSRYTRTLADKPLGRIPLQFRITVRRFFCQNPDCSRTVFAEHLAFLFLTPARARTTTDLADAHTAIGLTAGGEPGARLARALDMPTSPDTLLRRVKAYRIESGPPPRFIGIDDWAVRKGQTYGTMIVDLERQRVIALLPGRDAEPLAEWLRHHPQVEVISRDRWPAYAKAATEAAPQARQVADRWHLLKNLREALENFLARLSPEIRATASESATPESTPTPPPVPPPPPTTPPPASTPHEAKRQARSQRRQRVENLKAEGRSIREIARHLQMSVKTVVRILRMPDRPHGRLGRRGPSLLDAYRKDVEAWLASGGTNTADLYRLLKTKGCGASYDAVRRYTNHRLGSSGKPGRRCSTSSRKPPTPEIPSARKLSFEFACPKSKQDNAKPSVLDRVRARIPLLDVGLKVAGEFAGMIRRTVKTTLADWLLKASACGIPELVRFASGLADDAAAVSAALTEAWSNGPVEGQVNRLKAIKRSMYGRAGLALLQARVLNKA